MSKTSLMQSVCAAIAALALGTLAAHAGVDISTKATQNMSCANAVCSPTAKKAVLNVNDVTSMLAAGDLKITTGAGALDIHVKAPFSWTSTDRLTLDAARSITIEKAVVVAGRGALTLTTNDGGTGGDYWFPSGGSVSFWDLNSSLIINGVSFTLVKDIKTLAAEIAANPSGNFALANSYDASIDGTYKASPVQTTFNGRFEGLGHAISNLSVKPPHGYKSLGLFLHVGPGGALTNISLLNVDILGSAWGSLIGGLAALNEGKISGAQVTGEVRGGQRNEAVGGIAGENTGMIAYANANVFAFVPNKGPGHIAGGIAGINSGTISNSSAAGAVDGGSCCAENEADNTLGGLVGVNSGTVSSSYSIASVSGSDGDSGGGLLGSNSGSISNCYANAAVYGDTGSTGGGLLDFNGGAIANVYSMGTVQAAAPGGLISRDNGNVTNAYWDLDTSGITDPAQGAYDPRNDPGITGLSDSQLKSGVPAGFDPNVWGQNPNINNGYPYLLANPPPK
jgi:hypothetical protein